MKRKSNYYPMLAVPLAATSGVFLAFALPPRDMNYLGWIAFIPLLMTARTCRPLIAAGSGLICSLMAAVILAGRLDAPYQYANLVAVFGSLGLMLAVTAGFASIGKKLHPAIEPFFIACAGVTAELICLHVFPVNAAISQYRNPAMLRLASVTGIWGVSFLVWLVPAALIAMARKPKVAWPTLVFAVVVLIAASTIGFPPQQKGRMLRVAAIQADNPQDAYTQTAKARSRADVVVWPEQHLAQGNALPSCAARLNGVYVVADYHEKPRKGKPFNTAYMFSPDGKEIKRQRKRYPFGIENLTYGRETKSLPVRCNGFWAGLAICYDTQFTVVIRDLARNGAEIVFVPVHDPALPNSVLNYLHGTVIPFRAAENGMPIVSAELNGLSSIIDGSGRYIALAPANSICSVYAPVRLKTAKTFATRYSDWFAWVCVVGMVIGLGSMLHRRFM